MKVVRPGYFAKVGDYVREGWDTETRSIAPPYTYGIVVETQRRSPQAYTAEQIKEKPVRVIYILTNGGEMIRRYSVHVEVIDESR